MSYVKRALQEILMSLVIALVYISFREGRSAESSSIPVGFNQLEEKERKKEAHLAIKAEPRTETVNYTRPHLHNRPGSVQD